MPDNGTQTQTVWGNIGALIKTTTDGLAKLREADASYQGQTPYPTVGAFPTTVYQQYTPTQWAALGGLLLILGLIVFLVIRELRG